MRSRGRMVAALGLVAVLAGCAGRSAPPTAVGRSYRNEAKRFAFDAPGDWERLDGFMGTEVLFRSLVADEGFQANVNVNIAATGGVSDLDKLLELNENALRQFNGYKPIRAEVVDHPSGRKAFIVEAEHSMMAVPVRMKCCAMVSGDRQYTMTASMSAASADRWMPQMDRILDSFIVW